MNRLLAFGFGTYESLVQKLSSVDNPTNLYRVYQENKDQFKQEHIVLSLRFLGKFSRQINSENHFQEITSKLNDIVGQLTEYDVVDVLFWLRKFRQNRIPTNITNQTQNQLFQRIQQMSNNQMFSFRNMCNIYYDLSILNHYNESLIKSISEQILTSKQLSPFLIIQLLSALVIKINHCNLSKYDQSILTNSIKVLDNLIDSCDVEQKSLLFKVCAEVQFQNIPPKFQLPIQLKKIKDLLLDKVDILQEESVINIFKAYEYLPKQFDIDLLRELRDMILNALEQNPQSLSDKFLIQITEKMIKMTNQRIPQDAIRKLLIEICNRVQSKTFDTQLFNYLMPVLMKYKKIDEIVQVLQQLENKTTKILDYLFICGINMKGYVEEIIKKNEQKQIYLSLAISCAVYANRDAQEHLETFISICRDQIYNYPWQALKTIHENSLNFSIKYQLQEEAYLNLIEQVQQKKFDILRVFRELITCCCNFKCRNALIQLYDQQENKINPKFIIQKLVQQEIVPLDHESFAVLAQILLKDPKNIPIQKFVDYLTLNNNQLLELIKSDYIQQATKILIAAYQAQPEQKLYSIVNFAFRFEIVGYHSQYITNLIKKISEIYKANYPFSPYPDPQFVNLLINHQLLTSNEAITQLSNEKIYQNTKVQLYGIILSTENVPEDISELKDKIKADCYKALEQEAQYQPIFELITLGDFTAEELVIVKSKVQTLIPKLSPKQFFDLTMFAKDQSILKELAFHFNEFSAKLGINRIIRAADKFAKFQVQSQTVYNVLLETYGYSFNYVYNEQRIQILDIFSQVKIKQPDLMKRSLEKIKQSSLSYKNFYLEIVDILINLGFFEQEYVDLVNQILLKSQIQGSLALKLLQYYVLADQPIDIIDKIAENISDTKTKDNFRTVVIYEILYRKYPNSLATKAHEIFFNDEKFSKLRYKITNPPLNQQFKNEICIQYLNLMGVEFEINKLIDGINVQIYLPSIEASLLILNSGLLNYDQTTLNGVGILEKKLLESVTKNVITINFKQFLLLQTNEERANYLINQGIPTQIDINKIDFSSINIENNIQNDRIPKNYRRRYFGKQENHQNQQEVEIE